MQYHPTHICFESASDQVKLTAIGDLITDKSGGNLNTWFYSGSANDY